MIKSKFNKTIIGVIVSTTLIPVGGVFAQTNFSKIKSNNCTAVTILEARLLSQFANKQLEIRASRAVREAENAKNRAANDRKISEQRRAWDQNLIARINLIEVKISSSTLASRDSQLLALANFKTAINNSRNTKLTAVDSAMKNFRDGVDNIILLQKSQIDGSKLAYENAIKVAVLKSKEDCLAKVSPKTIKEHLDQRVLTARETFKNTVSDLNKSGGAIKALAEVKNGAIKSAQITYKVDYEKALAELKTSLSKN
ncbi:hypothetical protein COT98_01210 [Candidatus Falkowbacteria bacterium CG10_big_fil_rev_8_21_14_0_10_39_9]|uniref:Uncharacterized protein n=1 Tax=Candidatus Falkowbacteria bacterium CG10_big_fil_rev_8_21_14_0_10_39_9 TaxID=1974566 RepID=A0A2M6WQL5_9BACT|nr:MAG: hypothetical protein COT98_01210 [Candidatus Falkowbacteria bacterium CG10_big_fil_rev_8_21_14_0_10_39_9]